MQIALAQPVIRGLVFEKRGGSSEDVLSWRHRHRSGYRVQRIG